MRTGRRFIMDDSLKLLVSLRDNDKDTIALLVLGQTIKFVKWVCDLKHSGPTSSGKKHEVK